MILKSYELSDIFSTKCASVSADLLARYEPQGNEKLPDFGDPSVTSLRVVKSSASEDSPGKKGKRSLTHKQTSCPPNHAYNDAVCRPYVSPQALTVSCITPYGQSIEWYDAECPPNQICVSINTSSIDTFAARHAAYCVDYEYFSSLAKAYVNEGSAKAGAIMSQINFSAGQRASLEIGHLGVAAVITTPDNHTSIFARDLTIEAMGVSQDTSQAPAS